MDEVGFMEEPCPAPRLMPVVLASSVVGFSLLGDSFLYLALPLEYEALGLSLVSVGVLLSINRFIRFFSNTWAGYGYARYGTRLPLILASSIGVLTTLAYGLVAGFVAFLVARALWGVAWSFLSLGSYLEVVALPGNQRGGAMGLCQSISRTGSLGGVLLGGWLLDLWGFSSAVIFLAVLSLVSIPIAFSLDSRPVLAPRRSCPRAWIGVRLLLGDAASCGIGLGTMVGSLVRSLLAASLALHILGLVEGDTVSMMGVMIGVPTLVGILLAMQWIGHLAVGPVLGLASDRFGRPLTLTVLFAGAVLGTAVLGLAVSLPVTAACIALSFFSLAGLEVVLAACASDLAVGQPQLREYLMSSFSNWSDLGGALGPLIGYVVVSGIPFRTMYLGSALILSMMAMLQRWTYTWRTESACCARGLRGRRRT